MTEHEAATLALAALAERRPNQFDIVRLFLERPHLTQAQLAAELGVSQQNVAKLLGRGMKNFRRLKDSAIRASQASATKRNGQRASKRA